MHADIASPGVRAQLRALAYVHFCNNWFHYTMLAWLPTYFTDTLDLNLSQAAQVRWWPCLLLPNGDAHHPDLPLVLCCTCPFMAHD